MGQSSAMKKGDWCVTTGQPGGFRPGRSPVVRLGRVLEINTSERGYLRTDNTLVGGDSGGPLFDLDGKVIGIHSQIGPYMTWNLHVPVDAYRAEWDRLVKGEVRKRPRPYIGVLLDEDASECRIAKVFKDSPAEEAGLKENDVVTQFGDNPVEDLEDLLTLIAKHKPGDKVNIQIRRGTDKKSLKLVIGKHPA